MSLLKTAFAALGQVQREQLLEAHLRDRVARSLGVRITEVDPQRPLGSLGLDSLKAVELQHGLEREFDIALSMADVLSARHVADLVSVVLDRMMTGAASSSVPPGPATDMSRLSRGQEALWFLHQLSPDSPAYNIAYAMRVRSQIDASKLRRTLQTLIDRHACLRTRFENRSGRPWADVREREEVSFTPVDAAGWSDGRLQQYLIQESHRPFDLERGPLFKVHLVTRSAEDHVLLICVHHICVDFWSLVVLTDEMGRLYGAEDQHAEARKLPAPVAYAEFVRWQDEMLGSKAGGEHEAYWLKQLSGTLPVLNLPTDRPRPALQTHRGASLSFRLGPELTRSLHDIARQQQVTLYVLLLAAFQSLLHRYTGDTDVVIGSPVAGRSREGFGGIVGYFVNMVALRGDLSDDPTFVDLVSRARTTVLEALAHQDFPFALLVDRLEQNRDPSRSPVFQTAFVLEKPHIREELAEFVLGEGGATMSLGGLHLESLALEQRVAQFDLTLMMVETRGGLAASVQYNADLFDSSTISRFVQHYETLVEGIAADPRRRLSELPLLSVAEQQQLFEWKGEVEYAAPAVTLHELFAEQVERTPDAVAVACDEGQLSYRELNRRANRLAHRLRRHGVGPEVLVGVCMDRSPEMIVAILGILKAGGAYFPLDPDYPRERLAFMLRDGGVQLVLGKDRLAGNLPPGQVPFVEVDAGQAEAGAESHENPVPLSTGQNLAYVMYTSGSTGTPNGVAVCQQSVIRLVYDPNYVTLTLNDVILQLAPNTFDAATFEVWASLLHGGRLVLAPDERPSLDQVRQTLTRHRVSTLWLTAGLFHQLVDHDIDAFSTVRQLLAGGDVLSVNHVRTVLTRFPSCRLINGYGPTENTTFTCCHSMQGTEAAPAVSVPIGTPITGTEVFVVDRHQRVVPVGVPGELVTGGTGLARGYVGRPALTAERFVPDSLSERAGARLYRTGDLVRYGHSGAIEFLGRFDHQLKIRGFRVELGEIETALTSHPMIGGCVVVAQAGPTAKRLIAYLVADSESVPSTSQLREYLGQRLPDYMVPSVFVTLDAFPLTANGKVDRRALPAPDQSRPELDNQFVAPRAGAEEQLAAIWSELLGVDRVGRHDNFFELGGHSLIGTQVVSRVRDIARIDMPLRCLFERPTVAGLAEWLDAHTDLRDRERGDPGLVPVSGDEQMVVSFTQERLWLLEQLILGTPVYNIPAAIRLEGDLNVPALEQALGEVRRRHEALRTNFRAVDGQPIPIVNPASICTVPVTDLGRLSHDARAASLQALTKAEALRPFDLARDPLVRLSLARLGASEHVLFVTMHHIASDGWSIGILMRELGSLYHACSAGERSSLVEPAVQYSDFAHWQRRILQGRTLDEQLAYWTSVLSGARTSIELPIDRPRPSSPSYRGSTEGRLLQPELATRLHTFGAEHGLTPFMVVLAALNIVLARMSGQSDLVVGTVISGRTRTEIEPLIGCFMNFLPLRTTVPSDASGDTVLRQVQTTVLDADAHQECPFQKIVETVRPDRGSSQNPLYNVSFQFDNYPQSDSFTDTLQASFEPPHRQISQLDLRFVASETRDGTLLSCEYATDLFDVATIRALLETLDTTLEKLIREPETRVGEFVVPETLLRRSQPETIAVAATFTAEPVEEAIAFWTDDLNVPCDTRFAPYGQIFQELLAPDTLLATNRGLNVVLVRLEDWQRQQGGLLPGADPVEDGGRTERDSAIAEIDGGDLQRKVEEFGRALTTAAERTATPWLVCICPSSPGRLLDPAQRALHERMEDLLASCLKDATGVMLKGAKDLARAYPVSDYYDRHGDELGQVPYTREFFAALGTVIVRHFASIKRVPLKVIVLDCDNTLWNGVCGEDGAHGISIGPAFKALQEFMVAQQHAGRLLCLCSKNNEADVFEVFDRRDDMPLRREHIVSWRIDWQPKSANIRSLAEELQLGLDSFLFLDDSPVECAEVRANCPEVLSLQLPETAERIPDFLRNVWAFDHARLTSEDRKRTRLYQQNAQRERLREKSLTFAQFIADLDLDVSIDRMSPQQVPRVSQLTHRTNQFNVNKVGRSESELEAMSRDANTDLLTVNVSDRFGDYGLVGVAICTSDAERLNVDALLLSCRALGRGVEHRLLSRLGELAAEKGLGHVRIPLKPTDRNQPAREFLTGIGARYGQPKGDSIEFVIPTQDARDVAFEPGASAAPVPTEETTERAAPVAKSGWSGARLSQVSSQLINVSRILEAIDDRRRGRFRWDARTEFVAPRTDTERLIAGVWEQLLGLERVGVHEDFFAIGGHSLLATQVMSRLCDLFRVNLPLQTAFDAPTVAGLARVVKAAKGAHSEGAIPPVQPAARGTDLPLSFAQERLWFLDQFEPGSNLFNNPVAVHLRGRLHTLAFHQALQAVVNRHEALRTTFRRDGDRPVQVVQPVGHPDLRLADVRGCTKEEVVRLAVEESQRPFNLERGPLIRVLLLRLSSDEHLVVLNMHHIVSDGWSAGVLMNEVSSLYDAYTLGDPSSLTDLPIQYGDFAIWQRQWLDGRVLDAQLSYWRERLTGAPQTLDVPTDNVRPPLRTHRGALASRTLPQALGERLSRLVRQERVTSFMTFLAAFQVLISRYVGHGDVVVGTTIANRLRPELEGLIGFFANTLALRLDLTDNPSFREALGRVRDVTLGAYAHQDLPFEKLVEALRPVRDMSRTPVFQVSIETREESVATLSLRGLMVTREPFTAVTAKYDLSLVVVERDGSPARLDIEYNADLFRSSAMDRLLQQFEILLQAVVEDPGQNVADLPLLSERERLQQLVEWNDTEAEYPREKTIHGIFEEQVARDPDRVAVVFEHTQVTYRELDEQSNRLANYLREQGVREDTLVALCLDRTPDMIVAILGVLKAGGGYLPIDPAYPDERRFYIVDDSGVSHAISKTNCIGALADTVSSLILLDADRESIATRSSRPPAAHPTPDNVAYCIYTSGSTGKPKGVLLEHRQVVRLMVNDRMPFMFTAEDVWSMFHSYCFDFSVWEMYGALLYGGRLVIVSDGVNKDPQRFFDLILSERVTILNQTPSAFMQLMHQALGRGQKDVSLRYIIFGGEALVPRQLLPWKQAYPNVKLVNMYGITETTVHVTVNELEAEDLHKDASNIGVPIPTLQTYLVDPGLRLLPIGVPGELYVGGAGLARNYLNRPELTAERFVPHPFGVPTGARLYKSGDLARYLPDGEMEYLGRLDHQVKIRGFRIELGEIESVLMQHPDVREAIVVAREDQTESTRLVAYLTVDADSAPTLSELRSFLKARLADYMVPASFVTLDKFPLTPNGKVDRRALPAPDQIRPELEDVFVAARSPVEQCLAEIWCEVLGLERVGVHDNFFELGGHSLLATKVVSRIRAVVGAELPLRCVFETPTISELAKILGEEVRSSDAAGANVPPLERTRHEGPLPLSFAQQRLWFLDQMEPGNPYYNMPAALRVSGEVRVAALERAFAEIVRRHEVLQAGYVLRDGQPVQVRVPCAVGVRLVDLSSLDETAQEAQVRHLAALDARRPFDLSAGYVLRVTLLACGETSHTILFAMHHIVSDGWSLAIVVRELSVLYAAFREGHPSPLDELPIQYADFAVWQRKWLESDGLKSQLAYWRTRLGGQLPTLDIRTDKPRPEVETFRGADEILVIPHALAGALNRLSKQEHATLFMTLVAAYKTLLYRHVGEDDVVVGTDMAGRNRAELEGLIGFFVNLLVLRSDLSGNPTFREVLARIRETTMGAFAHQDVPFDRLVEELRPKRHRSRTPLFQMLFVMENVPLETLHLPGLTMTPMPNQAHTARFDLAVFVREQDDAIITKWTYKTDLFDCGTIQRLGNQYLALLEHIAAAPDTRVNDVAIQTAAEMRDQTLEESRRRETRMSSLVPGRRRARTLPEKAGAVETNHAAAEDDAAGANATKQVRTQ